MELMEGPTAASKVRNVTHSGLQRSVHAPWICSHRALTVAVESDISEPWRVVQGVLSSADH